jgi:methionyl-tRNA formyltransferase
VRIVFLGSGAFAVPCLEALLRAGHEVLAVVTQPDRPRGRGLELEPPPTKPVALAAGLPVLQPARIKAPEAVEQVRSLGAELQVVVAYGQILPRPVIEAAPLGSLNVHASLLPRYRGAAPIQWAIVRGEQETGVTTMLIDEGLDSGPLLLARATPIGAAETASELFPRLAALGAELLLASIEGLRSGTLPAIPQDPALVTHAPLIRKSDGLVDWASSAIGIERRIRGFHPWPGVTAHHGGKALRLLRAIPVEAPGQPGEVLAVGREGVLVACGGGSALRLLEVQPESRKAMPASAYAIGARLAAGARLS